MSGGDPVATRTAAEQPLVWNVSGLLDEGAGAVRDYVVDGVTIDLGDDLRLAEPIRGRIHMGATNRGLVVDADFTTALATECARCLREITVPLTFEIREEVLPTIDFHSGRAVVPSAEEVDAGVLRLTDHHELDLEQAVREAIFLAEPIAPLCREDCPGLCLVCGERLDESGHDHPDDDIDPRLAVLRGFTVE